MLLIIDHKGKGGDGASHQWLLDSVYLSPWLPLSVRAWYVWHASVGFWLLYLTCPVYYILHVEVVTPHMSVCYTLYVQWLSAHGNGRESGCMCAYCIRQIWLDQIGLDRIIGLKWVGSNYWIGLHNSLSHACIVLTHSVSNPSVSECIYRLTDMPVIDRIHTYIHACIRG